MSGGSASTRRRGAARPGVLERLWRMKLLAFGAALIAVVAAFLLTYSVHFSPFDVTPRVRPFGVAETQLLVDSDPSPLADIYIFTEADSNLAFNLAEVGNSPQVRAAAAASVHRPVQDIGVTEQVNEDVSQAASDAEEGQAGDTILNDGRQYSVFLRVDSQSFDIQIFTQAPTGSSAIRMANAVAQSLKMFTARLASTESVKSGRVVLRQIFPAYGGDVDRDVGIEAFVAIAACFVLIALIALVSVTAWFRRIRAIPTMQVGPE